MLIDIAGIDFPVTLDLTTAELRGTIPAELVLRDLRLEVDKFDGQMLKDPDFNRWRVENIDLTALTSGGVHLEARLNLKHREKIVSVLGKTHYTPWVSATLHRNTDFAAEIKGNLIEVKYRSHDFEGQGWYTEIVELLANDLFAGFVESTIERSLSQFNGNSVTSYLKRGQVIDPGGINLPLDTLIRDVSANVGIVPEGINFTIKLPDQIVGR